MCERACVCVCVVVFDECVCARAESGSRVQEMRVRRKLVGWNAVGRRLLRQSRAPRRLHRAGGTGGLRTSCQWSRARVRRERRERRCGMRGHECANVCASSPDHQNIAEICAARG